MIAAAMPNALALLLCYLMPLVTAAQEAEVEEVLVTGERLARPLLQTASSVDVVSGAELESLSGADRIDQVLSLTPNVQLGSGTEGPAIRGQDSTGVLRDLSGFLGGARPRATLQVDGRAVSFNEFIFGVAPLWDLHWMEVYRTPQSTTQGRNSIAGAIFVETLDPSYVWHGSARLLHGNYDTWQGSFAVNVPMLQDQAAVRLAGDFRDSRTSSELGHVFAEVNPNRDEYGLLRAKLLLEPRRFPGLRVLTTYVHSTSQQPQIEGVVAPFEERRDPTPGYGVFATAVDSLTAVVSYPVTASLNSTTTLSGGAVHVVRHALPGLGETDTDSRDVSLESLLHWQQSPSLRMLGGLHVLRTDLDQDIDLRAVFGIGAFDDRQGSVGFFGDAEWQLTRKFSLTAGLRYQRDSQRRVGSIAGARVLLPIDFDATYSAWLPKLSLAYHLGAEQRIGVVMQRAWNPGGTSLRLDTGEQLDFAAESLWNYELFLRLGFAAGRGTFSVNLFHSDFDDAQRAQPRAFTVPGGATALWAEIVNVPAARSRGLEAALSWRVGSGLGLRAAIGMLDTRILRTADLDDPLLHKRFARAPKFSGALAVSWEPRGHWNLSAQVRHNSAYYSNDANTPTLRIDPTTVVDLRAAYDRGHWQVFAYGRNVLNKFYLTSMSSPVRATAGDPREFGLGMEIRL